MIHRFAFLAPSPARVAGKAQAMESDMPANYERVSIRGIVRTVATIEIDGIGPVYFERPCLWHMGQKHWHIDFIYMHPANPERRYYGTVWNRTREIELSVITDKGTRLLPDSNFKDWRAAILKAARVLIDEASRAYVDALDSGDAKAANKLAMGLAPNATSGIVAEPAIDEVCSADNPITESPLVPTDCKRASMNNTRLLDDMAALAMSLDNRVAGYRLAGDGLLVQNCRIAARALRDAIADLETLVRLECKHDQR